MEFVCEDGKIAEEKIEVKLKEKKKFALWKILAISLGSGILLCIIIICCCFNKKKAHKTSDTIPV